MILFFFAITLFILCLHSIFLVSTSIHFKKWSVHSIFSSYYAVIKLDKQPLTIDKFDSILENLFMASMYPYDYLYL